MKLCRDCAEASKRFTGLVILSDCKEGCGDSLRGAITATKINSPEEQVEHLKKENDLLNKIVESLELKAIEREKEHARNLKKALSYGR